MTKQDYYRAQGRLEAGKEISYPEQMALMAFSDMLLAIMEDADEGDLYGTEGLEHAIGWD